MDSTGTARTPASRTAEMFLRYFELCMRTAIRTRRLRVRGARPGTA